MQIVDKFTMFAINVSNMPKAKAFYVDQLGLTVTQDYRQDDNNWWVSLTTSSGETTITLAAAQEHTTPGTLAMYFATSDIGAAHQGLVEKGVEVSEIQDNLYGPGSGVKWFNVTDPDGNLVHVAES